MGQRVVAGVVWLAAVGLLGSKTHRSAAALYRLQALAEAAFLASAALTDSGIGPWIGVAAVLVAKLGAVPAIMGKPRGWRHDYGARGPVGLGTQLLAAAGLAVVGLLAGEAMGGGHAVAAGIWIGAWLTAWLQLTTRYETWSLAWGLLSLDTASDGVARLVAGPLPESADFLVTLTTVALAVLLAVLGDRIFALRGTTDSRQLKELTG